MSKTQKNFSKLSIFAYHSFSCTWIFSFFSPNESFFHIKPHFSRFLLQFTKLCNTKLLLGACLTKKKAKKKLKMEHCEIKMKKIDILWRKLWVIIFSIIFSIINPIICHFLMDFSHFCANYGIYYGKNYGKNYDP